MKTGGRLGKIQGGITSVCLLPVVLGGRKFVEERVRGALRTRPQCAMLMMTDVLQLDVLTGPKAPCH